MAIRVVCPECGKRLKAPDEQLGRRARCPKCKSPIVIEPAIPSASATIDDQDVFPRPPKESDEDLIDMTAMVDIVFFLLIFFLVTSMHTLQASIRLPLPEGNQQAAAQARVMTDYEGDEDYVTVRIDPDDTIWVDDVRATSPQELLSKLREAKEGYAASAGASKLLVKASGDCQNGTVVMVLDMGNEAGMEEVRLSSDADDE